MAEGWIGRTRSVVRSSSRLERSGPATDRNPAHQEQLLRQQYASLHPDPRGGRQHGRLRRHLTDLLFDEIDDIDALGAREKERIKHNIRRRLPPDGEHSPGQHPESQNPEGQHPDSDTHPDAGPAHEVASLAAAAVAAVPPDMAIDHDHIVSVAAPVHADMPADLAEENARLARRLRECLAIRTDTARKVAVYLHLLLAQHGGGLHPHMVLDV
jgi:hypothetical protein